MAAKLFEIELAIEFVSCDVASENVAFISLDTGELFYSSEEGDFDELPVDINDGGYVSLPQMNDLCHPRDLIRRFSRSCSNELYDQIEDIFRQSSAYRRFKDLLFEHDLLDQWHQFEANAESTAIREWCVNNRIDLEPESHNNAE